MSVCGVTIYIIYQLETILSYHQCSEPPVVRAGVAVFGAMTLDELVVGSRHPNQPGVSHVEVVTDVDVVTLVLVFADVVVVLSRQPHHPGVWQVAVLDLETEVVDEVVREVVVGSEKLLLKKSHNTQS